MVGQTNVVKVQVTPAGYDLGAQTLTLVDSRGNVAPANITAVANNRLMSRAASANGSWDLSIEMTDDVTATNIAKIFDYDPVAGTGHMAYTLCVNGIPYTTYELAVKPSDNKSSVSAAITGLGDADIKYVAADGRVANLSSGKFPPEAPNCLSKRMICMIHTSLLKVQTNLWQNNTESLLTV